MHLSFGLYTEKENLATSGMNNLHPILQKALDLATKHHQRTFDTPDRTEQPFVTLEQLEVIVKEYEQGN